jgi:hypothetical protein
MSYYNGPKSITDGLVLCLDAANNKSYIGSGTAWTDLSGNNNTGTLTNGPTFTSSFSGGILFDGVDDYIESTTDITLGTSYALEIAFRRTASRSDWVRIFGHLNDTALRFWGIWFPSTFDFILWQSYTGGGEFSISYTFSLNTDYVISFSNSAGTCSMYINGVLVGTGSGGAISYTGNTSKVRIGYAGLHTYHIGPVYYARIYNRALSTSEVLQNYNAAKTRYGL